jgi:hypothetical protein
LFVKPQGSVGTPLRHSLAPTEPANVRATLLADAGIEDPSGFPTVFELEGVEVAGLPPRDFFLEQGNTPEEALLVHYQVSGDARDFANWRLTESIKPEYWP